MNGPIRFDIVIASVNRQTLPRTISSLANCVGDRVASLHVTGHVCQRTIDELRARSGLQAIEYHPYDGSGFCKASLLNRGLQRTTSELVLISDADILWERLALTEMMNAVTGGGGFCHVAQVVETDPTLTSAPGVRYTPRVEKLGASDRTPETRDKSPAPPVSSKVLIEPAEATDGTTSERPGPGLVMAKRTDWFDLGGYNENLTGWGWEDQDLLIRAQILGHRVCAHGSVRHISHPDSLRNALAGGISKYTTRNRNIDISCKMLRSGHLHGPLCPQQRIDLQVETVVPRELQP